MPKNDREVFDYLTASVNTGIQERQIAFMSYAQFAFEKREWIKLYKSKHADTEPSQNDIDGWIENITDSQFVTFRNAAERFFVDAADDLFQERLDQAREDILSEKIVSEVTSLKAQTIAEVAKAGDFWRQFGIALATAVLAPLIIGGIIAAAIVYDRQMFTGSSVADQVGKRTNAPGAPPADATKP